MAIRPIPEGSVEIQTGLWAHMTTPTVNGVVYTRYKIYSAEGYCFYDKTDEHYDEEGNLIPDEDVLPTQRVYSQYAILATYYDTIEKINADFVSVPVQEGFEIVSVTPDHEIT